MKNKRNQKGFISIIGLMIFALLTIVGLIVQRTTIDTINNIKATNNYYAARDIADSAMEALQFELKDHEAGYNKTINCTYENGDIKGTNPDPACTDTDSVFSHLKDLTAKHENVEISMEVKGRSTDAEKITGDCMGIGLFLFPPTNGCYTVPAPATGNAGKNCNLYNTSYETAELNNPCNWNKLQFGSTTTDRVVIPLYYEEGGVPVNPFKFTNPNDAWDEEFVLRLRTPCLTNIVDFGGCDDADRMILDDSVDDIVVQWQITGQCDDGSGVKECGMIPYIAYDANGTRKPNFSGITENIINNIGTNNRVLYSSEPLSIDTGTNDYAAVDIYKKLSQMELPKLSIALNDKLISSSGFVPYLEYQLLSVNPVADARAKLEANVKVNGNSFKKTIYEEKQTVLIDFAIQN